MSEPTKEQQIRQAVVCAILANTTITSINGGEKHELIPCLSRVFLAADIAVKYIVDGGTEDLYSQMNAKQAVIVEEAIQGYDDLANFNKLRRAKHNERMSR